MNRIGRYEGVVRLVLLLVVLPAVVYRLSLGRTIALWGEVRRAERTLAEADSAPIQPDTPAAMLDTVELIAGGGLLELLERLGPDSSAEVVSYTPYRTREGDDFTLRTAEIVLSGDFVPLLRTLDAAERELSGCRLLSSEFKTVRRGRQTSLQLTLVVQQLTDKP
ncbi:hypothetical protein [Alistipes indistinctus]|uniref:hypothetical protein n=1 Tax=Alistipes indistinctus TaxID=626932 RepID=UPI003F0655BA